MALVRVKTHRRKTPHTRRTHLVKGHLRKVTKHHKKSSSLKKRHPKKR